MKKTSMISAAVALPVDGEKATRRRRILPVDPNAALYPLPSAQTFSGLSRSTIYRHLADGTLRARKSGRTLLIEGDSLRALTTQLPQATFGTAA